MERRRARKLVWLTDGDNRPIYPADLPRQLGLSNGLGNDPYRSLVYFTRDIGYSQPTGATEFTEFYWGDWLRKVVDLKQVNLNDTTSYLAATTIFADGGIMHASVGLQRTHKPGSECVMEAWRCARPRPRM